MKLKKKTNQEEKSRSLLGDNAESFSKQPEEVLDVETGATSSSTTVSEDMCCLLVIVVVQSIYQHRSRDNV